MSDKFDLSEEELKEKKEETRSRAAAKLLTAWNGGLAADEASDYLNEERRIADEIFEDPDLVDFVEAGLDRYRQGREEGRAEPLSEWLKQIPVKIDREALEAARPPAGPEPVADPSELHDDHTQPFTTGNEGTPEREDENGGEQ